MIQKNILSENEAKVLNALFEGKKLSFFELEEKTGLESFELSQAIFSLKKKTVIAENNGFSGDFFDAFEKLAEKKEVMATA